MGNIVLYQLIYCDILSCCFDVVIGVMIAIKMDSPCEPLILVIFSWLYERENLGLVNLHLKVDITMFNRLFPREERKEWLPSFLCCSQ